MAEPVEDIEWLDLSETHPAFMDWIFAKRGPDDEEQIYYIVERYGSLYPWRHGPVGGHIGALGTHKKGEVSWRPYSNLSEEHRALHRILLGECGCPER